MLLFNLEPFGTVVLKFASVWPIFFQNLSVELNSLKFLLKLFAVELAKHVREREQSKDDC